jgi:hypothetical protein
VLPRRPHCRGPQGARDRLQSRRRAPSGRDCPAPKNHRLIDVNSFGVHRRRRRRRFTEAARPRAAPLPCWPRSARSSGRAVISEAPGRSSDSRHRFSSAQPPTLTVWLTDAAPLIYM